jgi:hypothetical protein
VFLVSIAIICIQIRRPVEGITVKLEDVPELNYFVKDHVGQLCVSKLRVIVIIYIF